MEARFYGANCIKLSTKKASVVIDDNLSELGLKSVTKTGEIALYTGAHGEAGADVKILIDTPGEYEVSDVSVLGIAARAHMDEPKQQTTTMYKIVIDDVRVLVVGHIYPDLSDNQLEEIGTVDVLFVPIGGNGYTLDGIGALKVIRKIEPKIVVPTHYGDSAVNYPVPQTDLETALGNMSMEALETLPKLKMKTAELTDVTKLIVLERQ